MPNVAWSSAKGHFSHSCPHREEERWFVPRQKSLVFSPEKLLQKSGPQEQLASLLWSCLSL
jgi:hypothetical protein